MRIKLFARGTRLSIAAPYTDRNEWAREASEEARARTTTESRGDCEAKGGEIRLT